MVEFAIRTVVEADYPRIVAILNLDRKEAISVDDFVRQQRNRPADDPILQVVIAGADGSIDGYGESRSGTGRKPGHYFTWVTVDPAARGRGAGAALYAHLEAWAVQQGAVMLESLVRGRDADAWLWAEGLGYRKHYHLFQSQLDLAGWDPAPFAAALQQAHAAGIRFTTLADEIRSEESYRRYYDFRFGLGQEIPDVAGRALPPYEQWRASIAESTAWDPCRIFLAVDGGRWVAMTQMTPQRDGGLYNAFTGVARACRGRGLALAVKVIALRHAQQQAIPYVRTSNHSVNAPMIAVNTKLGYVPYDGIWTLQKRRHGTADRDWCGLCADLTSP